MPTHTITHGFSTNPFQSENGLSFGRTESGFDTMQIKYIGSTSAPRVFADSNWPAGSEASGYPNMYIDRVDVALVGTNIYEFTVSARGLLGIQAVKRTISSKSQSYTTGAVSLPAPVGVVSQAQGVYNNISCSFLAVTNVFPDTGIAPGDALPLGTLPTPPIAPFTSLPTTPIYNYPYGWIQEGLDIDSVNGAEIYLIKQDWVYKYQYMPG